MVYMSLTNEIKRKAFELGFDLSGITDASPINAKKTELYKAWLESGFAGQMEYMHRNLDKRFNPATLLENAKSVIVVGLNYKSPEHNFTPLPEKVPTGKIASYACYEDYHLFIKKRLRQLIDSINSIAGQDTQFKICVDSIPLAERAFAVRAGLGFIGKNHMLINPKLGCQIFLGEIITNLKLTPDQPIIQNCSNCKKCIEICPTGALRPDGQFDANKCINYLTIEYKGEIPPDLAEIINGRLFGCEECILACPYQKDAPACKNQQFKFYPNRAELSLQDILSLNPKSFAVKFSDSVINRPGLERLKRNARICLANIEPPSGKTTG